MQVAHPAGAADNQDEMSKLAIILVASWLAGFAAFIGGVFARFTGIADTEAKREITHGVVAFGGGILIAAVAFALAPVGIAALSPVSLATTFCLGGIGFCILDAHLSRRGGSKAQFMAMLMDFLPEAISLGAVFLFVSGTILPLESMPAIVRQITHFNPFVLGEKLIREIFIFNASFSIILNDLLLLTSYAVILFILILIIDSLASKHFLTKLLYKHHKYVRERKNKKIKKLLR